MGGNADQHMLWPLNWSLWVWKWFLPNWCHLWHCNFFNILIYSSVHSICKGNKIFQNFLLLACPCHLFSICLSLMLTQSHLDLCHLGSWQYVRETKGINDGLDIITISFSTIVYWGAHKSKEEEEIKRKKG
jgi:hypothetical protein